MKYRDTTDPETYRLMVPLFTDRTLARELERAAHVRFRIIGLFHSVVGPEWSSRGEEQTDFFHYIHFACGGRARIFHRGNPLELEAGQAYWLTGNTPVVREAADRYEAYVLKFRCESAAGADLLLDWPARAPLCVGPWDRTRWEPAWRQGPLTTNVCLALQGQLRMWLAEGFSGLDEIITSHHETFSRFTKALSYLEENLGAGLRVSDLAREHGVSEPPPQPGGLRPPPQYRLAAQGNRGPARLRRCVPLQPVFFQNEWREPGWLPPALRSFTRCGGFFGLARLMTRC